MLPYSIRLVRQWIHIASVYGGFLDGVSHVFNVRVDLGS